MRRRRFLQVSGAVLGAASFAPVLRVGAASGKPAKHQVAAILDPALPVHPALQYGAVAEPDKVVRVIVQKTAKGVDGKAIANDSGGTYLEDFASIACDHVEIKQRDVLKLGKHKDVLYVSPDGPILKHAAPPGPIVSTANLVTIYPTVIGATTVWNSATADTKATGKGVTVAVLDSGASASPEIATNLTSVNVNQLVSGAADGYGHGTHVVGIIKGRDSKGAYIGVAPNANVVSVKISDDTGAAFDADLIRGLLWVYANRSAGGGIRVVNLSVSSGIAQSYKTSPVCLATELLWRSGIVVIVAAGNRGSAADAMWYPPANDPYCITVGALDDNATAGYADDTLASFSSRGTTQDGAQKPDIVAPGRKIYSALAAPGCKLAQQFPSRISADGAHIRLSGTSMSAPQVAGVVALLLEKYPGLTPDQVKHLLVSAARDYSGAGSGAKIVDINAAMVMAADAHTAIPSANRGNVPAAGVLTNAGAAVSGTAYWDTAYWDTAYWDAYWDTAYWDAYWDVSPNID